MKARMEIMRTFGQRSPRSTRGCSCRAWSRLSAWNAIAPSALGVAEFLQDHPQVAWVNYPGLPDN